MSDGCQNEDPGQRGPRTRRRTRTTEPSAGGNGRLPPHSEEIEQGVLGALLCPSEAQVLEGLNRCEEAGVTADWFYLEAHKVIWWAIADMHKRGVAVDVIMLHEWLSKSDRLGHAGGLDYVARLPDKGLPGMLEHYLDQLRERFHQRRLLRVCAEAADAIYGPEPDTAGIVSRAERGVLEIAEGTAGKKEEIARDVLRRVVDQLEVYSRGKTKQTGLVSTGIEYLDTELAGIGGANGNLFVLAARPGIGKTALALQVASHVAIDMKWWTVKPGTEQADRPEWTEHEGRPVGIFSLEMSADSLVQRMLFQRAEANLQTWRTGFAKTEEWPKLVGASDKIGRAPIWIDDSGRITIEELKAKARRMHRQQGVKLFIVDYLQLLRVTGQRGRPDRVQELAEVSGELQSLGKELQVPFLVLAQMNRDFEKEPGRLPRLSDLKDSGAIEQDADVVMFLYYADLKDQEEDALRSQCFQVWGRNWSTVGRRVNFVIAKNRYGRAGKGKLLFQNAWTKFYCLNAWQVKHGFKADKTERQELEEETLV